MDNDGHIILSCRETSEVLKISRETGETIWRWGGKNNDFTILGDHEKNASRYFKVQYSVRRVSNGNIIMFDNGADKNDLEREYTRAVEYELDEEAMTATMTWEYRHDPDILALSGGTVVRFPNGNTSINWGGASREGAPPYTEANPDGELVYEITYDSPDVTGNFSRFLWFDLAPRDTVTIIEIAETKTYEFNEGDSIVTGISLKINSYTGDGYNEVTVMRENYGPLYPEFPGRAPVVFAERINVSGYEITSINADIIFDLDEYNFTDLLMDEENLKETSISLDLLENNSTYFWRVQSVNDAGVSDWSNMGRFITTSPTISVNIPDGSESWQVGLEYMIRWEDNLNENVVLELYKNELVSVIVYDAFGREVKTLVNNLQPAGT